MMPRILQICIAPLFLSAMLGGCHKAPAQRKSPSLTTTTTQCGSIDFVSSFGTFLAAKARTVTQDKVLRCADRAVERCERAILRISKSPEGDLIYRVEGRRDGGCQIRKTLVEEKNGSYVCVVSSALIETKMKSNPQENFGRFLLVGNLMELSKYDARRSDTGIRCRKSESEPLSGE